MLDIIENSLNFLSHELSNYELIAANYLLKIKISDNNRLDIK